MSAGSGIPLPINRYPYLLLYGSRSTISTFKSIQRFDSSHWFYRKLKLVSWPGSCSGPVLAWPNGNAQTRPSGLARSLHGQLGMQHLDQIVFCRENIVLYMKRFVVRFLHGHPGMQHLGHPAWYGSCMAELTYPTLSNARSRPNRRFTYETLFCM